MIAEENVILYDPTSKKSNISFNSECWRCCKSQNWYSINTTQ